MSARSPLVATVARSSAHTLRTRPLVTSKPANFKCGPAARLSGVVAGATLFHAALLAVSQPMRCGIVVARGRT